LFNLSGLTLGVSGRLLIIHNTVAFDMIIEDEELDNTDTYRFNTMSAADVTCTGLGTYMAIYSAVTSRWIQLAVIA
jgi:hypothetical protein